MAQFKPKEFTEEEKLVINELGDTLYTVAFMEEQLGTPHSNIFTNAPCALQEAIADGYYNAVKNIVKNRQTQDKTLRITYANGDNTFRTFIRLADVAKEIDEILSTPGNIITEIIEHK